MGNIVNYVFPGITVIHIHHFEIDFTNFRVKLNWPGQDHRGSFGGWNDNDLSRLDWFGKN
jgi:hypothetical protein